jgi:hypothetical protein
MTLTELQIKELKKNITTTLQKVYKDDISLINRKVNERTIAYRFGFYLIEEAFKKFAPQDIKISIDLEYNRNGRNAKSLKNFNPAYGKYPDLIIHERETNDNNILIIEFKKPNVSMDDDFKKLIGFTDKVDVYKFGLGVSIVIKADIQDTLNSITYFKDGVIVQID